MLPLGIEPSAFAFVERHAFRYTWEANKCNYTSCL